MSSTRPEPQIPQIGASWTVATRNWPDSLQTRQMAPGSAHIPHEISAPSKHGPAAVAQPIVQARRDGPFLSVEDLRRRAKLGQGAVDMLRAAGALEGLDETSQLMMDFGV